MTRTENDGCVVIKSPVEFLIVGAAGPHDRILVRSENCQLDLIGFSQLREDPKEHLKQHPSSIFGLLSPERPMQSIETHPFDRGMRSGDYRESLYRFSWVGYSTSADRDHIRHLFERQAKDLDDAIEESDIGRVEWSIAPVIHRCSTADLRRRSSRRVALAFLASYLLIGLVSITIWMVWESRRLQLK
jgi:hypothetical protein